jgi:micrococcal nuclease
MRRLPLLVVVIVLVVAGCAGGGPAQTPENDTSAPTAANTPTATPAATATTPTPTTASTPTATQAPTATPTDPTTRTVTVINVVDGDTVDVRWPNGTEERVRLVGVDTPEVHVPIDPPEWEGIPDTEAGHTCLRDAGDEASVFVERSLSGKTVEISFDANLDRRGYYGRLLGYLHVAGETINYRLVAAGHARVYDSDFTERERF